MNTWWLAIDRNQGNASYEKLKNRKVVAQGWPKLGDLRTLCTLVEKGDRSAFTHKVRARHLLVYGEEYSSQASRIMWDLLSLRSGDLVVGIEGVAVKGICRLEQEGWESYKHDSTYEYAQTVGFPVEWVDWEFDFTPRAPNQGVPGIRQLQSEREKVISVWENREI